MFNNCFPEILAFVR